MTYQKKWMDHVLDLARQNAGTTRAKTAAVIVQRNTVRAVGYNQYKTHPLQARFSKNRHAVFLHAEIDALRDFFHTNESGVIQHCDMYVGRVLRDGTPALAKPCKGCARAIMTFDLKNIYWSP